MNEMTALHNYLLLRSALLRHQQLPWQLSAEQQVVLATEVKTEEKLVTRALASPQASSVVIDATTLHQAVENFVSSMAELADVESLLHQAGLQQDSLVSAIGAELRAAAILETLTMALVPSEQEVYQWFESHPEKFVVPERREVFQILITVNDEYAENRREVALQRITEVSHMAAAMPERFGDLAQAHSECPSAVEAGRLGVVPSGHLYPELDRELFNLESGAISAVVESPLGFHLLRCGVVEPARRLAWEEVRDTLTQRLTSQKRKHFLRNWLMSESDTYDSEGTRLRSDALV